MANFCQFFEKNGNFPEGQLVSTEKRGLTAPLAVRQANSSLHITGEPPAAISSSDVVYAVHRLEQIENN